jgi:hypothetical protein
MRNVHVWEARLQHNCVLCLSVAVGDHPCHVLGRQDLAKSHHADPVSNCWMQNTHGCRALQCWMLRNGSGHLCNNLWTEDCLMCHLVHVPEAFEALSSNMLRGGGSTCCLEQQQSTALLPLLPSQAAHNARAQIMQPSSRKIRHCNPIVKISYVYP